MVGTVTATPGIKRVQIVKKYFFYNMDGPHNLKQKHKTWKG